MSFIKNNRFLLLLALLAAAWSWGQPMLNSHSFRQCQTAQMAQVFLQEGWQPFQTKVRFLGRPGITVLEFPVYQTLMAALTQVSGLSLENSGRLLSLLSALLLALALASALRLARRRLFSSEEAGFLLPPETAALLFFASPLLFSLGQWVTIELMNAALAAWALVFFWRIMSTEEKPLWGNSLLLFVCALGSLVLKPHGIFALLPLFCWGLSWTFSGDSSSHRPLARVFWAALAIVPAAVAAFAWYRYGDRVNTEFANPYSVSATAHHLLNGEYKLYQPQVLFRLAQRFVLYALGPGALVFLAHSFLSSGRKLSLERRRLIPLVLSLLCLMLYLGVFTGANYIHNYYQSAALFPLFFGLTAVCSWRSGVRGYLVLAVCLAVNLGVSAHFLTRQDKDWKAVLAYLSERIPAGGDLPEISVLSNVGESAPIISFYRERYLKGLPPTPEMGGHLMEQSWVAVCDQRIDSSCDQTMKELWPAGLDVKGFGPLRVYFAEDNSPSMIPLSR